MRIEPDRIPEPEAQPSPLSDRDTEVVQMIEEEGLSVFTFDGLRRITGVHPETLSRALERLEEKGMVVRSPEGYSTTDKAKKMVVLRPAYASGRKVPILHTFLPYGASMRTIVSALKGRWFDRMRWVGMADGDEGVVMKWITDDGSALIDARFWDGQLDVEARVKNEGDLPKAVRAAHQIIGRISKLYSSPRPGSRHMLMQIGYFVPYAM
ncbi:MAG: hypothetical protein OK438_08630 [Thaumarchaeota archaeon]|nr:hypothetical protein [Nitrososphaerota archaeon]